MNLRREEEAIEYLNKANEKQPNIPTIYSALGKVYFLTNQMEKSAQNYKKSIELFKQNPPKDFPPGDLINIYLEMESLPLVTQNSKEAIPCLDDLLMLDPINEITLSDIAFAFLSLKNYPKAKLYAEKLISINVNHADAFCTLANVLKFEKQFDRAKSVLQKVFEIKGGKERRSSPIFGRYFQRVGTIRKYKAIEIAQLQKSPNDYLDYYQLEIL